MVFKDYVKTELRNAQEIGTGAASGEGLGQSSRQRKSGFPFVPSGVLKSTRLASPIQNFLKMKIFAKKTQTKEYENHRSQEASLRGKPGKCSYLLGETRLEVRPVLAGPAPIAVTPAPSQSTLTSLGKICSV